MSESIIPESATVYVAGHRGLAGSALVRRLEQRGISSIVGYNSSEVDLTDRAATTRMLKDVRPDVILLAAAKVGGIAANMAQPHEFLSDNLQIQLNVMDAASDLKVPHLLFLSSSCVFPREAPQPMREEYLMTGPVEPTNASYAIAKIAGMQHVAAVRQQHGLDWKSVTPSNLYGPGDNFDPQSSHLVPGMIRRFHNAKLAGASSVDVWGTGLARRELLFVDDFAEGALFVLENGADGTSLNVGTGTDLSVREIAEAVAKAVGFEGELVQDLTKPDGMPQKLMDVSRVNHLGWRAKTGIDEGLRETYAWFLKHHA